MNVVALIVITVIAIFVLWLIYVISTSDMETNTVGDIIDSAFDASDFDGWD